MPPYRHPAYALYRALQTAGVSNGAIDRVHMSFCRDGKWSGDVDKDIHHEDTADYRTALIALLP
jgi:hypothetical protein